ncbi:MAG: 30S ribosomal protein S20 [Pirellulales bacterium]|mgnify:FL=1|nr:30S ribosomal protein S20 [Pirellulales bacterium]
MPNSDSAKKRLRQNKVHQLRNRSIKSNMRGLVRRVRTAISAGDVAESQTAFQIAVKKIDQAAAKKVIHANKAARTKSRLSKAIKTLQS